MNDQNFQRGVEARLRGDYETSYQQFLESAKQGNPWAQNNVGWLYISGEGVQQSFAEAALWFRKAANQGTARAQYNLGLMYLYGEGSLKDDTEAVQWFIKAAEQGFAKAQYNLGLMYREEKGVSRDYIEAYKWFSLAAAQGLEPAATARDSLEQVMTPLQITQALARSREWRPSSDA